MSLDARLSRARVLVELGWLAEAEAETTSVLEEAHDDLSALSLFAKIKHVRGQLSQAIACWAHIHARSPHNENVMMQLRAMLQLAQDPERGASEFLVLGGFELARKPAVQLELEHAFALHHEHKPDEARAAVARLAARQRGHDAQLYKVAVIAGAWLAELSGDLAAARTQLEQLGHERGYEHDLDRLFALVRVYERLGTQATIEAAAKICRHVLRELETKGIEKISLFSQLAALERRAGRTELAAELDRAFLAGVRRRMHRPSLHELVRVASRDYLPLELLRTVRPAGAELPAELPRRERALAHALRGELAQARMLLADGGERLDRRYLADLAVLEGDDERAIALYLETLAEPPEDPLIVGWLLDRYAASLRDAARPGEAGAFDGHARAPSAAIAARWTDPARRDATRELLEAQLALDPLRPEPWRRLAVLHALAGDATEAATASARADVLAKAAAARAAPIGRVLAAGVYHFIGKAKGLVHEVWVHRERAAPGRGGTLAADDIHGNVTPEMRAAIRNTFVAVREYARAKFPVQVADLADYTYSYKLPKEDEPSGGLSAGLPSALAFLSVFLQQPVRSAIASSGALVTEAHDAITIGRIGEADYKVKAAYHANLATLVLPLANRADLERSTLVPPDICREIVQYAADLDQAVKLVFGADVFVR
ncbi:MAG TPA: S16 family serine protease [Kofleriaceae bacterium]|nr:S16 family serine protease [Kofleriaceae bacterium]